MEIQDPVALGRLAVKVGLITEEQFRDALEEIGGKAPDMMTLLRTLERKGWLTPWQSGKLLKGDDDGYYPRRLPRAVQGGVRELRPRLPGGRPARRPHRRRQGAAQRWSEDQKRIDLFIREGRVGQTLKHPNIVEVLTMSQDPATKQYFIVMEFVEGGNLREILQIRKKLSPAEALRILEDAAAGLTYAYSRGVTHRDVKLTNLLISSRAAPSWWISAWPSSSRCWKRTPRARTRWTAPSITPVWRRRPT